MKIFGRHIQLFISKEPIEKLELLKSGKAHIRVNPVSKKKRKEKKSEQGTNTGD